MSNNSEPHAAVLAVDGGASKIDAVLLTAAGEVMGCARGEGTSFDPEDHDRSVAVLAATVRKARERAGIPPGAGPLARVGVFCMAGADLPADDRRIAKALAGLRLADELIVRNDTFAVLRAGSERGWGIGVVCGTGLNCSGVGPDGRIVRYAALGLISGDEGGGGWLAEMGIGSAVRGRDGRGRRTALERAIPGTSGCAARWRSSRGSIPGASTARRCAMCRRWSSAARPRATRWPPDLWTRWPTRSSAWRHRPSAGCG